MAVSEILRSLWSRQQTKEFFNEVPFIFLSKILSHKKILFVLGFHPLQWDSLLSWSSFKWLNMKVFPLLCPSRLPLNPHPLPHPSPILRGKLCETGCHNLPGTEVTLFNIPEMIGGNGTQLQLFLFLFVT